MVVDREMLYLRWLKFLIPKEMKSISPKTLKWIAITYFVLLGVVNLVATWINTQALWAIDYVILLGALLPLVLNSVWFHTAYGILGITISLVIGLVCLSFNLNPEAVHTSQAEFAAGYLLAGVTFACSLALVYAAVSERKIAMQ